MDNCIEILTTGWKAPGAEDSCFPVWGEGFHLQQPFRQEVMSRNREADMKRSQKMIKQEKEKLLNTNSWATLRSAHKSSFRTWYLFLSFSSALLACIPRSILHLIIHQKGKRGNKEVDILFDRWENGVLTMIRWTCYAREKRGERTSGKCHLLLFPRWILSARAAHGLTSTKP